MKPQPVALPNRPKGLRFNAEAVANGRFEVNAAAAVPTISIFDAIDQGLTQRVADALRQIGPRPVLVEVNSKGGDFFEAVGAFNVLARHPAPVTASVVGIAASGASVLVMAADQIEIYASATLMVHNASGLAIGNRHAMLDFAATLEQLDQTMQQVYAARSARAGGDLTPSSAGALMDAETFLNAERARQLGLVDTIVNKAAAPAPTVASKLRVQSKAEIEARLHSLGFARSLAAAGATSMWAKIQGGEPEHEPEIDLDTVARAIGRGVAEAISPRQIR